MSAQDPWASTTTVELGTNGQSQDPAPTPPKEQPEPPKNNMTNETTGGAAPGATPPADQTDKDKGGNKPPEPDRIKLELPSGAEPPTMGFPKLVQRWYNFWQTEDPANRTSLEASRTDQLAVICGVFQLYIITVLMSIFTLLVQLYGRKKESHRQCLIPLTGRRDRI